MLDLSSTILLLFVFFAIIGSGACLDLLEIPQLTVLGGTADGNSCVKEVDELAGTVDSNSIGRICHVLSKVVENGSGPGLYGAVVEFIFKVGLHLRPDVVHLAHSSFHCRYDGGGSCVGIGKGL